MSNDILENLVEVTLDNPEKEFLKVVETLTRIGISNQKKELFPSCYLLQKKGKYYLVHFKELFALDGKETTFSDDDRARRNTIANFLEQCKLVKIVDPSKTSDPTVPLSKIKILKFKDKADWKIIPKYQIGSAKHKKAA